MKPNRLQSTIDSIVVHPLKNPMGAGGSTSQASDPTLAKSGLQYVKSALASLLLRLLPAPYLYYVVV